MKYNCKRFVIIVKYLVLIFLVVAAILGLRYWFWINRAHTVVPGILYRSAQLSPTELSGVIDKNKIQAVLDLRVGSLEDAWYRQEREVVDKKNIRYYHFPMESYVFPKKGELQNLAHILQTSPKPLLIHCEGGADRTGLASAIYLILQNRPLSEAEKEYSLQYYVISKTSVGKLVIPRYAAWLTKNKLASSRQNFLNWLAQNP